MADSRIIETTFLQREKPAYRWPDAGDVQWVRGGFRYLRITSDGMRRWNLVVPFWVLGILFAAPPGLWWRGRMKVRRRRRLGLCASCGYDLRATPGRCPECGKVVNDKDTTVKRCATEGTRRMTG